MKEVSYVQKEDKKVNNQYRFVSHDAVVAKIRPALIEAGIVMVPTVKCWVQNGDRTEATIAVDFVNADKPDDKVTIEAFGFGVDKQDKGPGKAVSYACKYAILKAFALETGDDPERDNIDHNTNGNGKKPESKQDGLKQAASQDDFMDKAAKDLGGGKEVETTAWDVLNSHLDSVVGDSKTKRKNKMAKFANNAGIRKPFDDKALHVLDNFTADEMGKIVEANQDELAIPF